MEKGACGLLFVSCNEVIAHICRHFVGLYLFIPTTEPSPIHRCRFALNGPPFCLSTPYPCLSLLSSWPTVRGVVCRHTRLAALSASPFLDMFLRREALQGCRPASSKVRDFTKTRHAFCVTRYDYGSKSMPHQGRAGIEQSHTAHNSFVA